MSTAGIIRSALMEALRLTSVPVIQQHNGEDKIVLRLGNERVVIKVTQEPAS